MPFSIKKLEQGQSKGAKGILERSGWLERCGGLECFGWPTLSILLCRQVQISVPIVRLA